MAVASSGRPAGVDHRRLKVTPPSDASSAVNIANGVTMLRLLSVIPIALILQAGEFQLAFWLFVVAGLSDGVDGFLARRVVGVSRLGVVLDPIADKVLLVGTLVLLGWQGLVPSWVPGLVIVRDLLISVGVLLMRARVEGFAIAPSLLGKACTFTQILYVGAVLAGAAELVGFAPALATLVLPAMVLLTLASGAAYTVGAIRLAAAGANRS
jgi:cardiolipin synthase (CMP-forming)